MMPSKPKKPTKGGPGGKQGEKQAEKQNESRGGKQGGKKVKKVKKPRPPPPPVDPEELARRKKEAVKKQELLAHKAEITTIKDGLQKIQRAGDASKRRMIRQNGDDANSDAEDQVQQETEQKKQEFIESRLMIPVTVATAQAYDYSERTKLLLVIPDDCTVKEQIEAFEERVVDFYIELVKKMDAFPRAFSWYFAPLWLKWFGIPGKAQAIVYENIEKHMATTRIYYLPHFIAKTEISRLLSAVPAVCSKSDGIFQLQSSYHGPRPDVYHSHKYDPSKFIRTGWLSDPEKHLAWTQNSDNVKTFGNLSQAINACTRLLNIFERRRNRMKCIVSSIDIFAVRGFTEQPRRKKPAKINRDIIAITGVAPQFNVSYLDYADFFFDEELYPSRIGCYEALGGLPNTWKQFMITATRDQRYADRNFLKFPGGRYFHIAGYLQTMKDSFFLWFRAFDDQVRQRSSDGKGYLQIPAMGCDFSSISIPGKSEIEDFDQVLQPLLVQAIEETLETNYFPNIIKIGFCDFSGKALFSPNKDYIQHINLIPCPDQNICQFDGNETTKYVCGLLVPGNSFSLPGNELEYESIEAEVGMNTTLRIVQSYIHNKHLLDPRNHVAVDGPCMLFEGRETNVKVPCIISDTTSVQDYTWKGEPNPAITGEVQREASP